MGLNLDNDMDGESIRTAVSAVLPLQLPTWCHDETAPFSALTVVIIFLIPPVNGSELQHNNFLRSFYPFLDSNLALTIPKSQSFPCWQNSLWFFGIWQVFNQCFDWCLVSGVQWWNLNMFFRISTVDKSDTHREPDFGSASREKLYTRLIDMVTISSLTCRPFGFSISLVVTSLRRPSRGSFSVWILLSKNKRFLMIRQNFNEYHLIRV